MRISDVVIKGYVGADIQKELMRLFGKLEWSLDYHPLKEGSKFNEVDLETTEHAQAIVFFDGLPCADLLKVYSFINRANRPLRYKDHRNAIKLPGIRIRVNGMDNEHFMEAMRDLFALAFAKIPKECLKSVDIIINDNWDQVKAE